VLSLREIIRLERLDRDFEQGMKTQKYTGASSEPNVDDAAYSSRIGASDQALGFALVPSGLSSLVHGNKRRSPSSKTKETLQTKVLSLFAKEFEGFNQYAPCRKGLPRVDNHRTFAHLKPQRNTVDV
jgi:hypothetical protein